MKTRSAVWHFFPKSKMETALRILFILKYIYPTSQQEPQDGLQFLEDSVK